MMKTLLKAREFLGSYWKKMVAFLIIVAITIFSYSTFSMNLVYGESGREFLLSAISQALAAAFALVFIISLVAVQLTTRYSPRMLKQFFTMPVVAYMIFFVFSIIFPLYAIVQLNDIYIRMSLILTFICFILLIPYFYSFREKLNPAYLVEKLKKEAEKEMGLKETAELKEISEPTFSIISLFNLIMGAYTFKDYDTFEKGLRKMGDIVIELINRIENNAQESKVRSINAIIENILGRITNAGLTTIKDPRAPCITVEVLKKIGIVAAYKQKGDIVENVGNSLQFIGNEAVTEGREGLTILVLSALRVVGRLSAFEELEDGVGSMIDGLLSIGDLSAEKGFKNALDEIAFASMSIGEISAEKELQINTWIMVNDLHTLTLKLVEKRLERQVEQMASALRSIGCKSAEKKLVNTVDSIIRSLEELALKSAENGLKSTAKKIEMNLLVLALKSAEKGLKNKSVTQHAINALKNINKFVFSDK